MTRAATITEVGKFASEKQWSLVYAYIHTAATVLACQVNQAVIDYDMLSELAFDGVTAGASSDVLAGMTVLVGRAPGLCDRGMGYARKAPTSSLLYLGETSGIHAQNNDYITVLNEFGLWLKQASIPLTTGTVLLDTDLVYSDQLAVRKSIVLAGGDRALELSGSSVTAVYALSGAASYVTTCSGASVSGGTTATPSVTVSAAGDYRVTIVATASTGAVTTTHRWLHVVNSGQARNAVLTDNSADGSGWSAHVKMPDSTSGVRDRAKVLLFARDYYDGTLGSIGSLTGCENGVHVGWIDGKSITQDINGGTVEFDVRPASWWLDQIRNPVEIKISQVTATPATWKEMQTLSVDAMVWHILEHFTTALNSMDVILTGDTRTAVSMTAPIGSLWGQITAIADGLIKANSFVNQYGQLVISIATPLVPVSTPMRAMCPPKRVALSERLSVSAPPISTTLSTPRPPVCFTAHWSQSGSVL